IVGGVSYRKHFLTYRFRRSDLNLLTRASHLAFSGNFPHLSNQHTFWTLASCYCASNFVPVDQLVRPYLQPSCRQFVNLQSLQPSILCMVASASDLTNICLNY